MFRRTSVTRWVIGTVAAALVALLTAPSAFAQGANAAIEGVVRDQQGGVLPGATITLREQESGVTRVATTGEDGRYRFPALPPGRYALKAELSGFATLEVKDLTLTIGLEMRQDFTMSLRTIEETVTVSGEAPVIDTTKSEVAGVVTQQQIDTIPINTRQFLNLALLMPGTSQDGARPFYNNVTIGPGTTFYSNAFLVDGVNNTWAEEGEPRQNFPQGAVQEFKVSTTQFKAEYGLATGGLILMVTKSGTNQIKGEAFEYFRDKSLNALNKFEKERHDQFGEPKPNFRRHQFGFSVGGPIVRDRTHFFATIERTQTDEFFTVSTGKPEFYSAVEGTFKRPRHTNLYVFRLDHQINPKQTMFVRYGQEDEFVACYFCGGISAANNGFDWQKPARSVAVGHTWVKSPQVLHDFRFQYAYAMYQIAPAGTPIITDIGDYSDRRVNPQRIKVGLWFPSLFWGGNFDELGPEKRWQVRDTLSVNRGSHDLKFGIDFSHIPFTDDGVFNINGTYIFGSDQPFNPNDPASVAGLKDAILFFQYFPPVATSVPVQHFSWFVQDDWKPRDNLTVNLGLRYDVQFGSFNEDLDPNMFPRKIPFIDPKSRGDRNNFGPRVGLSWDIRKTGESVLRAGYGVYYDNIRTLNNMIGEWRNLSQFNIIVPDPPYPDPFLGVDPLTFASTAPPNLQILANNFVNPYAQQYNIGLSQQIARDLAIHLDGVYVYTLHDRNYVDINAPDPVTGVRPLPEWGRIDQDQSILKAKYGAFFARLDKRFSNRYQFLVSYTLSKNVDNQPGQTGQRGFNRVTDQANYGLDYGPADTERRHTLVASGAVLLPYDITLGAVWTVRTSLPFSAVAGQDINGDGFVTDFVPGTTRNQGNRDLDLGAVNTWRARFGLAPISESQIDSTKFNALDIRVSKAFPVAGGRKLELMAQVFNVLGIDNLNEPFTGGQVSNALSDSFGRVLTARPRQQAELAVRFIW